MGRVFYALVLTLAGCSLLVDQRPAPFRFSSPVAIPGPPLEVANVTRFVGAAVRCLDVDHDGHNDVVLRGDEKTLIGSAPRLRWAKSLGAGQFEPLSNFALPSGGDLQVPTSNGPLIVATKPIELRSIGDAFYRIREASVGTFSVDSAPLPQGIPGFMSAAPGHPDRTLVGNRYPLTLSPLTFDYTLAEYGPDQTGMLSRITGPFDHLSAAFAAAADLDGAGKEELVAAEIAANGEQDIVVRDESGSELNRATLPAQSTALTLVDMNGDGTRDVVVGADATSPFPTSRIFVYLDHRAATLGSPLAADVGPTGITEMAAADLNLDGKADLALVASGQLFVLRGNGDGSFAEPLQVITAGDAQSVAVCDLNGAGGLDLVISSSSNRSGVALLFNEAQP